MKGNQDTNRSPTNKKQPCSCQTCLRNLLFHLVQRISLPLKSPDRNLFCTTKVFPKFLLLFECQASFQSEHFGSHDYAPLSLSLVVCSLSSLSAHAHAKKTPVALRMIIKFSVLELHHRCIISFIMIINCKLSCFLLARLVSNWNFFIDNKTATSMRVSWKNLSALLSQSVLYYITIIKSSNGSIVNGNILQGITTSDVFYGLSPYMEYRLNVLGVNDNGKVYKSSEATEWTEESGMFITLPSQID